ncbi:MAG TPA: hypothetical protein VN461_10695 [Vicinamibacteria bacterium]|nr:hypothetical protein [Vicinamibacteria bacterium]
MGRRPLYLLAHLLPPLWLFGGGLAHRVPYFRDISTYYFPNLVFLARSLSQGVWPLWNPTSDGGAPFLLTYPIDLLLVLGGGVRTALTLGPPLHLFLAMAGASLLARRLGARDWSAWATGAIYGLSGFVLSCVNLVPLLQAAAWAPWVVLAFLSLLAEPSWRRVAVLAALAALQASTLAVEIQFQTAVAALVLAPDGRWLRDRRLGRVAAAGVLAALMATPVLLGMQTVLEGTARAAGFTAAEALHYSAGPMVLLEAVLPKLFGDVHAFSDLGFWGQPFYTQGYPYLLSLYLGPPVLLLAARAGRATRLYLLVLLGVALGLGAYGPLALLPPHAALPFRHPVKFLFLATLGISLLAGRALDVMGRARGLHWALLLVPGLLLLSASAVLRWSPDAPAHLLGTLAPLLAGPSARGVAATGWPVAFEVTGFLSLGTGLLLGLGGRWSRGAAGFAVLDLLIVNASLNPLTEASFYDLRPEMKGAVAEASAEGLYRWFSYGVANSPGLAWNAQTALRGSDVWLYYLDRQSLLPRTHVLDGLEGAFDVDRTGWAPQGSTLPVSEVSPSFFRQHHARLRLANVRWVLSFAPLPSDLVSLRRTLRFPELKEPLQLYEIRDPLPRALFVPRHEVELDTKRLRARVEDPAFDPQKAVLLASAPPALPVASPLFPESSRVAYERIDPHTIRIRSSTPPGYILVLDGYHPGWKATSEGVPVPLLRADDRAWALPTPGGDRVYLVRYHPSGATLALALSLSASLASMLLWARGRPGGRSQDEPIRVGSGGSDHPTTR